VKPYSAVSLWLQTFWLRLLAQAGLDVCVCRVIEGPDNVSDVECCLGDQKARIARCRSKGATPGCHGQVANVRGTGGPIRILKSQKLVDRRVKDCSANAYPARSETRKPEIDLNSSRKKRIQKQQESSAPEVSDTFVIEARRQIVENQNVAGNQGQHLIQMTQQVLLIYADYHVLHSLP
jgi:hypothetical protein